MNVFHWAVDKLICIAEWVMLPKGNGARLAPPPDEGDHDVVAYPPVTIGESSMQMLHEGRAREPRPPVSQRPPLKGSIAERVQQRRTLR
jgi:hypothetical protein